MAIGYIKQMCMHSIGYCPLAPLVDSKTHINKASIWKDNTDQLVIKFTYCPIRIIRPPFFTPLPPPGDKFHHHPRYEIALQLLPVTFSVRQEFPTRLSRKRAKRFLVCGRVGLEGEGLQCCEATCVHWCWAYALHGWSWMFLDVPAESQRLVLASIHALTNTGT